MEGRLGKEGLAPTVSDTPWRGSLVSTSKTVGREGILDLLSVSHLLQDTEIDEISRDDQITTIGLWPR